MLGFSLAAARRGYSLLCPGFSLQWLLLLWSTGFRLAGFSSCGWWATTSSDLVVLLTGLVASQCVGSSWIGDQTLVPCIARQILNHWTNREAPACRILIPQPGIRPRLPELEAQSLNHCTMKKIPVRKSNIFFALLCVSGIEILIFSSSSPRYFKVYFPQATHTLLPWLFFFDWVCWPW